MTGIHTVVVPIDFSDTSRKAFNFAASLTKGHGCRIHLLHVIPDPLQQPWITQAPGVDYAAMEEGWRTEARVAMQQWIEEADRTGLVSVARVQAVVLAGKPANMILDYAEAQHADLIVMGAHGESAVTRFFLGSVAERVVRHADRPVLTVPRGCDVPLPIAASTTSTSA